MLYLWNMSMWYHKLLVILGGVLALGLLAGFIYLCVKPYIRK